MQYAIEMYFNKELEDEIFALAQKVADNGLSTKFLEWKTRPHVTLGCFNDVDEALCTEALRKFAESHRAMNVSLDSVSMFNDTKVVFLSPTMTREMYRFQEELHDAMKGFDTKGWEWYMPDDWVPHCTVALTGCDDDEVFYRTSELILREYKKSNGVFSSVGLVKITFPVQELVTFELGKSE